MLSPTELDTLLQRFPQLRLGIVGDLFLDRYLEIDPQLEEISVETGLVAHQVVNIRNAPGVVGTVINNLLALGVTQLLPVSVIGDDGHGDDLLRRLTAQGVNTQGIVRDPARLTPTYTKPMRGDGAGWRELSRLDVRTRAPMAEETTQRVIQFLRAHWEQVDGWIVLDQLAANEARVVGESVRKTLVELAGGGGPSGVGSSVPVGGGATGNRLMFVDSRWNIREFSCGMLKTNARECTVAAGVDETDSLETLQQLLEQQSTARNQTVVCTVGERGMLLALPGERAQHIPGFRVSGPLDIVGAGDSATSGMVAACLAGARLPQAALVGNLVASITIQQLGVTGTASPQQVRQRFQEVHPQLAGWGGA